MLSGLGPVTALVGKNGKDTQSQVTVDPSIEAAELVGSLEGQDPPQQASASAGWPPLRWCTAWFPGFDPGKPDPDKPFRDTGRKAVRRSTDGVDSGRTDPPRLGFTPSRKSQLQETLRKTRAFLSGSEYRGIV